MRKHLLVFALMILSGGASGCLLARHHQKVNLPDNRMPTSMPEACKQQPKGWKWPGDPPEGKVRCV